MFILFYVVFYYKMFLLKLRYEVWFLGLELIWMKKKLLVEKDVFKMDLIKFLNCFKVKCFKVIYNEFLF